MQCEKWLIKANCVCVSATDKPQLIDTDTFQR